MPRGFSNYSFVVDSNFQPFTMQEMLVPFAMYKDAFEKSEEAYNDLKDKSDSFKYLADTLPEGSRARSIYEGYANDLNAQAQDLAQNGLNMSNRRALTGLKQRYQGEIGRLVKADEALKQERELRRKLGAQDSSILYADDNLSIDSFLDGANPNLYSISGNELYAKGAAAGKAASSRVYGSEDAGSTLGGYYRDYVQRMGYTPEQLAQFGEQIANDFAAKVSVLPELQQAANQILEANGVTENFKNNPSALRKAQQQVIRGLIDGAVYTESHNPQRDLGKLTKSEETSFDMQRQNMKRQAAASGLFWDEKSGSYKYDKDKDPVRQRQNADSAYTVTNSGNPVYLDEKKRPYALGPDGKTKYYDNDKDGNYTDRNPFVKPDKPSKPVDSQESLQRTGGLGIMVARKGGKWISNTTDNEYSDAGAYIPVFDNIWGTRSNLIDWGGDWNLSSKASGKYRYFGDASNLPLEAIQSINKSLPSKATLKDYDVYGVLSRNDGKLRDGEKYDYVLWPKGQPFPYNQVKGAEQKQSTTSTPVVDSYVEEDDEPQ